MDPDANLAEQQRLTRRMLTAYFDHDPSNEDPGNGIDQDDAARLCELVHALDTWISQGGFLPRAWQKARV